MNKEIYALLGELRRSPDKRRPERLQKLAGYLSSEGPNEAKQLLNQWLAEHPEAARQLEDVAEIPPEPAAPESMQLSDEDRSKLRDLLA